MLPSGLQELFGTLAVGLVSVLLPVLAWRLCAQAGASESVENFSYFQLLRVHKIFLPAALLLGIYTVGIIAETVTDQLVDSERALHPGWPPKFRSETSHRVAALLNSFNLESGVPACSFVKAEKQEAPKSIKLQPSFLGRFILSDQEYHSMLAPSLINEKKFLNRISGRPELEGGEPLEITESCYTLGRAVDALYYIAKNWSYSQSNYFEELQAVQRRIDFLRSLYLILAWLGPLVLIGGIIGTFKRCSWLPVRDASLITLLIMVLGLGSWYGWGRAEINYNERAWGYFLTSKDLTPSNQAGASQSRRDRLDDFATRFCQEVAGDPSERGVESDLQVGLEQEAPRQ
jgi:hypothetical protein